jgi:lysophospholipase L1-like esterase
LATLALGPVLYVQGRRVRRTVPRLPEASGPRSGAAGEGPALSLLVAGDSAAAGVGAATQDEALVGRLVADLRDDYEVTWRLEAKTGATTADTLRRLAGLPPDRFDVLVTSLGVNDITRGIGLSTWLDQQRALLSLARDRFGTSLFVLAGLPPVDRFPALPQPLRWYLGRRAKHFTGGLRGLVGTEARTHLVDLRFSTDPSLMGADGFHPGPGIYKGWAERVARVIRSAPTAP